MWEGDERGVKDPSHCRQEGAGSQPVQCLHRGWGQRGGGLGEHYGEVPLRMALILLWVTDPSNGSLSVCSQKNDTEFYIHL